MALASRFKLDGTELVQNPISFEPVDRGQPIVEFVPVVGNDSVRIVHEPTGVDENYREKKRSWRAEWRTAPTSLVRALELLMQYQASFTWEAWDFDANADSRAPVVNPSGDKMTFYAPERPLVNDSTFKVYVATDATWDYAGAHALGYITFPYEVTQAVTLEYTWKPTLKVDSFTKRRCPYSPGRWDCEAILTEV